MTYRIAISVWEGDERKYSTFFDGTVEEVDKLQDLIRGRKERSVRFLLELVEGANKIYSVPLTWWDHFKMRWFPDWLERYFPIKWEEIHVWTHLENLRVSKNG